MNAPLDRPATKVLIRLYDEDIAYYRRLWGNGWTGRVRELVAADVRRRKAPPKPPETKA